jgi:hypothetical protein
MKAFTKMQAGVITQLNWIMAHARPSIFINAFNTSSTDATRDKPTRWS